MYHKTGSCYYDILENQTRIYYEENFKKNIMVGIQKKLVSGFHLLNKFPKECIWGNYLVGGLVLIKTM